MMDDGDNGNGWSMRSLDLEVKLCNCAACRRVLIGRTTLVPERCLGPYAGLPRVYTRREERPYCQDCHAENRPPLKVMKWEFATGPSASRLLAVL